MSNEKLEGLLGVWNIVKKSRVGVYGNKGILYFLRDSDGVIQEKYFPDADSFFKKYPTPDECSLVIDLSRKVE